MTRRRVTALGRANDRDPNVQIEIQAARIEIGGRWTLCEHAGAGSHFLDRDPAECVDQPQWHAGWLAREMQMLQISTPAVPGGVDVDAWDWDPSRPVAEQYPRPARDLSTYQLGDIDSKFDSGGEL